MNLRDAKIWGGIGAILSLIGLGVIGFILKLVGVKKIAEATGNNDIFRYYLYSAVLAVVAFAIMSSVYYPMMMRGKMFDFFALGTFLTAFIVAVILLIIAAVFMKKSYDLISLETKVGWFRTTAILYIIGAVLLFVGVGALVLIVAAILEIVAFFSLPDTIQRKTL